MVEKMQKKMALLSILVVFGVAYSMILTPTYALTLDTSCDLATGFYQEVAYNGSAQLFNNSFTCPNGCANNELECDGPAQPEHFLGFGIVVFSAAFIFAILALKLDEDYKPLKFMFLSFTVLYIAYGSYVASGFATLTLNSLNTILVQGYIVGIFTLLAVVFYFVYLILRKLAEMLMGSKNKGRPFKW